MDAIALREAGQAFSRTRDAEAGMTACGIAGIALGVLIAGIVLSQVPDIIRYIRMSSM